MRNMILGFIMGLVVVALVAATSITYPRPRVISQCMQTSDSSAACVCEYSPRQVRRWLPRSDNEQLGGRSGR